MRTVEQNGIIVTTFATDTDDIDAFSQYIDMNDSDVYIIALSSNKESAARINFDIAHELGHIMLHEWSEDEEVLTREEFKAKEKEANEFAAAFLLPGKHRLLKKYHWIRKSWIIMSSLSADGKSLLLLCFTEVVTLA